MVCAGHRGAGPLEDRLARWNALWAKPVQGWDFSEFEGRVEESEPPWCYEELVCQRLGQAGSALDIGTGGGEFLLRIQDHLPIEVHATEGWETNLDFAREALAPLGVEVRDYDAERDERLPYEDASLDVVLSRHEAYCVTEVVRVLRPGGWFITQQVDGRNLEELTAIFGAGTSYTQVTLENLTQEAEDAGLIIERAEEWSGPIRFDGVDTLVSYLRCMPWQLPVGFTIDDYADELLALDRREQPLELTERRFIIVSHLPAPERPPADPFASGWRPAATDSKLEL